MSSDRLLVRPGGEIQPLQLSSPGAFVSSDEVLSGIKSAEVVPNRSYRRSSVEFAGGQSNTFLPSTSTRMPAFGSAKAICTHTSTIAAVSVDGRL